MGNLFPEVSNKKIILVTAELKSFKSRAGGLGPAVEELAYALSKLGCDVSVISLFYRHMRDEKDEIVEVDYSDIEFEDLTKLKFWVASEIVEANVKKTERGNVKFYFLDNEKIVSILYEGDNLRKAIFLARGTLELLKNLGIEVNIVHLNDGHTGLIPLFFKAESRYNEDPVFKNLKFVFTVHNAGKAYQQIFDVNRFSELGVGEEWRDKVVWNNEINLTFTALVLSDICNTVSSDYAETLKVNEGLGEIFREKKIFGITNGIDVEYWRMPELKNISSKLELRKVKDKAKRELLEEVEKRKGVKLLSKKLTIIIPRRFADQKGFEIFLPHIDVICKERREGGIEAQMVVLGRAALGDPIGRRWIEKCKELSNEFKGKFVFIYGFDEALAKKMYWGGDLILYPSLPNKEPCGTGYMMAAVNGTVTLGTDTGGMVEKLIDFKNGFKLEKDKYNWEAFFEKLKIISKIFYEEKSKWNEICWNAFNMDVDINKTAEEYVTKIYLPVLKK